MDDIKNILWKVLKKEAIQIVSKSLELLNSITPRKPMPPEMKIRFEDLKRNLELIMKINK
jgi:hypothetical protein